MLRGGPKACVQRLRRSRPARRSPLRPSMPRGGLRCSFRRGTAARRTRPVRRSGRPVVLPPSAISRARRAPFVRMATTDFVKASIAAICSYAFALRASLINDFSDASARSSTFAALSEYDTGAKAYSGRTDAVKLHERLGQSETRLVLVLEKQYPRIHPPGIPRVRTRAIGCQRREAAPWGTAHQAAARNTFPGYPVGTPNPTRSRQIALSA